MFVLIFEFKCTIWLEEKEEKRAEFKWMQVSESTSQFFHFRVPISCDSFNCSFSSRWPYFQRVSSGATWKLIAIAIVFRHLPTSRTIKWLQLLEYIASHCRYIRCLCLFGCFGFWFFLVAWPAHLIEMSWVGVRLKYQIDSKRSLRQLHYDWLFRILISTFESISISDFMEWISMEIQFERWELVDAKIACYFGQTDKSHGASKWAGKWGRC